MTALSERNVVAVFDLDGTITDCDTYISFLKACLIERPSRLVRSFHLPFAVLLHKGGHRSNAWLKMVFLKAIAGGWPNGRLEAVCERHVDRMMSDHLRAGALLAIDEHRRRGHHLMLATASFDFYVEEIGRRLGFDSVVCTNAKWSQDGRLVGEIDGNNCYGDEKVRRVLKEVESRESRSIVAYSDHHSDWPLLAEADEGVAVHPTTKLKNLAANHGVDLRYW